MTFYKPDQQQKYTITEPTFVIDILRSPPFRTWLESIFCSIYEEGCEIIICDVLSSEAHKVATNLKGKSFELDVSDSRQVSSIFNDINNFISIRNKKLTQDLGPWK